VGTHNLLLYSKSQWETVSDWENKFKFIQISTDEVYGALGQNGSFTENTPLNPTSPYSASKASADLLCLSYYKTYGFPVIITRSSNNFGPRQDYEKLIPKAIINSIFNFKIPVYGSGLNIRDWIFVEDNCNAIYKLSKLGVIGEVYNIGGNNEQSNLQIINSILNIMGKSGLDLVEFVAERSGHDFRYSINDKKSKLLIGEYSSSNFIENLKTTILFYESNLKK
jgi:dTDP-glucose 4,6-dehydratase